MSAKILVIGENRRIKRTLALTLVLKQVYDWHVYMSSVRRRPTTEFMAVAPQHVVYRPAVYEHHIEPRIEKLTIADSPWMRYLEGYGVPCP